MAYRIKQIIIVLQVLLPVMTVSLLVVQLKKYKSTKEHQIHSI